MLILIKVLASPREFKKQFHLPMKNQFVYKYQTVNVAFEIAQQSHTDQRHYVAFLDTVWVMNVASVREKSEVGRESASAVSYPCELAGIS